MLTFWCMYVILDDRWWNGLSWVLLLHTILVLFCMCMWIYIVMFAGGSWMSMTMMIKSRGCHEVMRQSCGTTIEQIFFFSFSVSFETLLNQDVKSENKYTNFYLILCMPIYFFFHFGKNMFIILFYLWYIEISQIFCS